MKTLDTTPGSEYAVKSAAGCDVYTPSGQVICRIMPSILGSFCASTYVTCFSDDAAEVTLVSSGAPGGTGGDTLTISQALAAANRAESAADRAEAGASAAEMQAQGATVANSAARAALAGAQAAETNAEASAQAAATSEGNATAAAQASATSEENAAASAQASATSEANAADSADRAETAQVAAQASENNAAASADRAASAQAAAELAASTAQAPESLAVQAARPATMVLLRGELEALLGSSAAWRVDTDGQKIVVHTDRLAAEQLAAVEDVLARFVPGFVEVVQYNHDISIPWQEIPEGFTVLEYLESTGTQYIDLYADGTSEDDFFFDLSKPDIQSSDDLASTFVFSCSDGVSFSETSHGGANRLEDGLYFFQIRLQKSGITITDWTVNTNLPANKRHTIRIKAREVYINEEYKSKLDSKYVIPVFAISRLRFFKGLLAGMSTFYGLKWTRATGEKIADLIPALDPTGAPCMVNRATRTPLYNAGTGAFIAGVENQGQLDNMLRKLPDRTGQDVGTLQVRLAAELQTPENEAKLDAMLEKNWEISQAA